MALTAPTMIPDPPIAPDRTDKDTFGPRADAWTIWERDSLYPGIAAFSINTYNNALDAANSASSAAVSAISASNSKNQTGLDRTQTGLDRAAASNSAAAAAASADMAAGVVAFTDTNPVVKNAADPTKRLRFDLSALSAGATRVLSVPDKSGTLATLADIDASGPIGDIRYSTQPPTPNWKLADGASYLQSVYGALYAKLGQIPNGATLWKKSNSGLTLGTSVAGPAMIVFANGVFIRVGFQRIDRSLDGKAWIATGAAVSTCVAVAYGNGVWIAIDKVSGGEYARSVDNGASWVILTAGGNSFNDIIFDGAKFVAVTNSSDSKTSIDGLTWTAANGPSTGATSIAFGAGLYVEVDLSNPAAIRSSPDLVTWTTRVNPTGMALSNIRFLNGVFIGVGPSNNIIRSTDGVAFTAPTFTASSNALRSSAFGNGRWMVVGDAGGAWYSADTLNWISCGPVTSSGNVYAVAYGGGLFTVSTAAVAQPLVSTSPNGAVWTSADWIIGLSNNTIAYGNGIVVAIAPSASAGIGNMCSADGGVTWTYSGSLIFNAYVAPKRVIWNGALFIAIVYDTNSGFYWTSTSPDGVTWTVRTSLGSNYSLLAFSGATSYVYSTAGNASCYKSTDSITWTAVTNPLGLTALTTSFNLPNGVIVLTQGDSRYYYSTNAGASYSTRSVQGPGTTPLVTGVMYGNGMYMITTTTGNALLSTDLEMFRPTKINTTGQVMSATFASGLFVLNVLAPAGSTTAVVTSRDGENWSAPKKLEQTAIQMIAADGTIIASTNSGIYRSPVKNYDPASEFVLPNLPTLSPELLPYMKVA